MNQHTKTVSDEMEKPSVPLSIHGMHSDTNSAEVSLIDNAAVLHTTGTDKVDNCPVVVASDALNGDFNGNEVIEGQPLDSEVSVSWVSTAAATQPGESLQNDEGNRLWNSFILICG